MPTPLPLPSGLASTATHAQPSGMTRRNRRPVMVRAALLLLVAALAVLPSAAYAGGPDDAEDEGAHALPRVCPMPGSTQRPSTLGPQPQY